MINNLISMLLTEDLILILIQPTRHVTDLLAILQKSLDRALFLYAFICEVLLSGVIASIPFVHIRTF